MRNVRAATADEGAVVNLAAPSASLPDPPQRAAAPSDVVANVAMLEPRNLARSRRAMQDFEQAVGLDVGERLLEELVAGEIGIAMQLLDVEAGLASLLAKTLTDPRLAATVAQVFRSTTELSGAVRKRIEHSLESAARLRTHRIVLASRRRDDV